MSEGLQCNCSASHITARALLTLCLEISMDVSPPIYTFQSGSFPASSLRKTSRFVRSGSHTFRTSCGAPRPRVESVTPDSRSSILSPYIGAPSSTCACFTTSSTVVRSVMRSFAESVSWYIVRQWPAPHVRHMPPFSENTYKLSNVSVLCKFPSTSRDTLSNGAADTIATGMRARRSHNFFAITVEMAICGAERVSSRSKSAARGQNILKAYHDSALCKEGYGDSLKSLRALQNSRKSGIDDTKIIPRTIRVKFSSTNGNRSPR